MDKQNLEKKMIESHLIFLVSKSNKMGY